MHFIASERGRNSCATCDVVIDFGVVETLRRRIELSLPGLHHRTRDVLTDTASDAAALSSATAIIIGVRDRLGAPSTTAIEQLRAVSPHVGVFVVTDANVEVEPWLQRHAHAGTDEIFCFDSDAGRSAFADRIRFLVSAPAPEIALRELWQFWEPLFIRSEAMYCVRNGYRLDGFSPNQWFGVSEKKFRTRFRGLSQPTPWTLGRLGRQLRVSELKLRGYHTMAEVATLLGFETAMQLTADRRRLLVALQRWPRFRQLLGDT